MVDRNTEEILRALIQLTWNVIMMRKTCTLRSERKTQVADTESGKPWLSHVHTQGFKRVYNLLTMSHDTKDRRNGQIFRNGAVYFKVEGNLASHPHSCHMLTTLLTFTSVGILKVLMLRSAALSLPGSCQNVPLFRSVNAHWNIHQAKMFGTPYGNSMYWSENGIGGNRWKESKWRCWFVESRLSLKCWLWWSPRPSKVSQ